MLRFSTSPRSIWIPSTWVFIALIASFTSFPPATFAQTTLGAAPPPALATKFQWTSLTSTQKTALAPLQATWESLSERHQRKWIALSQNFLTLTTEDRQRLHERMAQWAALKPKERQQARLNFATTKKIPAAERASNWEAYQALSPEEKEALAQKAAPKPTSAALATKPPLPEKLTPIRLTRNSSQAEREKAAAQQPSVNQKTLLPQPGIPKPQDAK